MKSLLVAVLVLFAAPLTFAEHTAEHVIAPAAPEWMKYMKPGSAHQKLSELAGKWNYTSKWWAAPDAKVEESKGSTVSKLIYGGRFLHEEVKGKMGKDNFEGVSITGYDAFKEEYQSVWYDSFGTGMMVSSGKWEGDTLAMSGTKSCPRSGLKNVKFRTELKMFDKNHHMFTSYSQDKNGKEYKSMEIHYMRAGVKLAQEGI